MSKIKTTYIYDDETDTAELTELKEVHLEWAKVYWVQDYEVVDEFKNLIKENKSLKASRNYWRDKAEKLIKENKYYKKKAREFELALKIVYSDKPDLYKLIFWDEQR